MIDNDAPYKLIGDFVIAVGNTISGSDNFLHMFQRKRFVPFQNSVNSFTNYFKISFNSTFGADITDILLKYF